MIDFPPLVSVNGRVNGAVSVTDRGLAYGDGLFETMRLARGVIPYWPWHWNRLKSGAKKLHIELPEADIERYLQHLLELAGDHNIDRGVLKLTATRGESGRGYQPQPGHPATIIIQLLPAPRYPENYYRTGVDVSICQYKLPRNRFLAGIKHLNKLDYAIASLEWQGSDFQEALLFDTENCLVEACSRNVFLVKDGKLQTPAIQYAGVAGVMRQIILEELAPSLQLATLETELSLADLLNADEVFLCNSVTGIWPVQSILRETRFGRFPVTEKLQQALDRHRNERIIKSDCCRVNSSEMS